MLVSEIWTYNQENRYESKKNFFDIVLIHVRGRFLKLKTLNDRNLKFSKLINIQLQIIF